MGDDKFQQSEGSPIGLNLSQAVARAVMQLFDKEYLEQVRAEGLKMRMYCRYIDDSNQIIEAEEKDEETVESQLMVIANRILEGIEMECDRPGKIDNRRLPILDMACWINDDGYAMYTFYEKPTSSKQIISARSAHPETPML